jgi:hypothetical protein
MLEAKELDALDGNHKTLPRGDATMKNPRSLVRGICAFVAVLALSFPAAAKSWKCACQPQSVIDPDLKFNWLTFDHDFEEFELIGYSGDDEKKAIEKCGEHVTKENNNFTIEVLRKLAETRVLSPQKTMWKRQNTNLCKMATEFGLAKLTQNTAVLLTCRAYDSSLGKTQT